jgi:hypothetical protein
MEIDGLAGLPGLGGLFTVVTTGGTRVAVRSEGAPTELRKELTERRTSDFAHTASREFGLTLRAVNQAFFRQSTHRLLETFDILGGVGTEIATNGFNINFRETISAPRSLEELF